MHSSKRDRRSPRKTPGATSPLFSPPFKGTMLCLGLETHHCSIGLSFRPESNLPNVPLLTNSTPVTSFLPAPEAADVLCRELCRGVAGMLGFRQSYRRSYPENPSRTWVDRG